MAYLDGLGVKTVVEETVYFDRDFLSEYAALYSTASLGFPNFCRRLHFFSEDLEDQDLDQALAEDRAAMDKFQSSYQGFSVYRPLARTPLGRTVLSWYPDRMPDTPRVVQPSREYTTHLCGLPLRVTGLAWQQQDGGVSACASVAIWTILHSSAFSDSHAIPTIADVTRSANQATSSGKRMFPSGGLNQAQIADAIRASRLDPMIIDPMTADSGVFSVAKFARSCSSLIRSGYPVMLVVRAAREAHAVCAVGFRDVAVPAPGNGEAVINEDTIRHFYIHDDNLGCSVRYRLEIGSETDFSSGKTVDFAQLSPEPPDGREEILAEKINPIIPLYMVAAVHQDMRLSINDLHNMSELLAKMLLGSGDYSFGLNISAKIMSCRDYLSVEIPRLLTTTTAHLPAVRRKLAALPLSFHLGVVRLSVGDALVADVVIDTTIPMPNTAAFCHVLYDPFYSSMFQKYVDSIYPTIGSQFKLLDIGQRITVW